MNSIRIKKDHLISIIVPIYNAENTLMKCVNSILNQTYKNLEVILVNDGSSDSSGEICESLKKQDSRVKIIHQTNSGVVKAIKEGLDLCAGSFIGFVDSDDYIEPDMYEELYKALIKSDVDYVHSQFYEDNGIYKEYPKTVNIAENRIAFLRQYVLDIEKRMIASRCTNLYKKSLIVEAYSCINNYCHRAEDSEVMIAAALLADSICFVSKGYYHYVIYSDSESRKEDLSKFKEAAAWYDDIKRMIESKGLLPDTEDLLEEYYKSEILSIIATCFGKNLIITRWIYPDISEVKGKNIILFAGGNVGKSYYSYLLTKGICNIVAWVDTKYEEYPDNIVSPDCILRVDYDYVLIAVKEKLIKDKIEEILINKYSVPQDRILWKEPRDICKRSGLR